MGPAAGNLSRWPFLRLEKDMSANPYLSTHLPGVSGGSVDITAAETGIKVIDTGLREVRSATAVVKASGITANEESLVAVEWGLASLDPGQIRFVVEKGGTNHGTAADSAVTVAFLALGDR